MQNQSDSLQPHTCIISSAQPPTSQNQILHSRPPCRIRLCAAHLRNKILRSHPTLHNQTLRSHPSCRIRICTAANIAKSDSAHLPTLQIRRLCAVTHFAVSDSAKPYTCRIRIYAGNHLAESNSAQPPTWKKLTLCRPPPESDSVQPPILQNQTMHSHQPHRTEPAQYIAESDSAHLSTLQNQTLSSHTLCRIKLCTAIHISKSDSCVIAHLTASDSVLSTS